MKTENIKLGVICPLIPPTSAPDNAPIEAAIPHDAASTNPDGTPTKRADSGLLATDRIAKPNFVFKNNKNNRPMSINATIKTPMYL